MNNVVDEVLAGSPKYDIYDENGVLLYSNAIIELATQVTTQGTPLNKALFDSIQSDLNTRLLISSKSTQSEAQQGTNNSHYMTPLRVKEQLQYLTETGSDTNISSTAQSTVIFLPSDVPTGANRVIITGTISNASTYQSFLYINGTSIGANKINTYTYPSISSTQVSVRYASSMFTGAFKIEIDLNTNIFTLNVQFAPTVTGEPTRQSDLVIGKFSTLTDITASLRGSGSVVTSCAWTTTYIY